MIYRRPEISDRELLQDYVSEHRKNQETGISASMGLQSLDYDVWIARMHSNALQGDPVFGKTLLYLCLDGDTLVGLLSIRYELSVALSEKYGHIGYGVRPSQRKKGYAAQMLAYALSVCREKGMKQVLLGCFKDNLASAAVIQKNGGVLAAENDNYKQGRLSQYYLVKL